MAVESLQDEKGIALDDFLRAFNEAPVELFDGEKVLWMPSVAGHTEIIRAIIHLLEAFVLKHELGDVLVEAIYVLEYSKDWVKGSRIPDILFYAMPRLADYKGDNADWKRKPYVLVPELVIEVVSPNDGYSEINRKVDFYLQDGVQEIWIIDPQAENAFVHSQDKTIRFAKDDKLSGAILPEFEIDLKQLFSGS